MSAGSVGRTAHILAIDDDEWALRLVATLLREAFPVAVVETRLEPLIEGEFDVYLIDNDFSGEAMASRLASAIRQNEPNALIVAFSATLDRETLKSLLNAGCDGAFDKGRPEELAELVEIIRRYLESGVSRSTRDATQGVVATVRAIRDVLAEWNRRVEYEEARLDRVETPRSSAS